MQPSHEVGWIDVEAGGESQQAGEAEVAFSSFDFRDEREAETNAIGQPIWLMPSSVRAARARRPSATAAG